jgi:hypothetical protein
MSGNASRPTDPAATGDLSLRAIRRSLEQLAGDSLVRTVIGIWLLSRLVVLTAMTLASSLTVVDRDPDSGVYDAIIQLGNPSQVSQHIQDAVSVADVGWYAAIADTGYESVPYDDSQPRSWAFFPLFPMLWRGAAWMTGEYPLTGMAISHVCLLLGLLVVARLGECFSGDRTFAERAVFYLAFAPTSYFFSLPMTESLFLMLSASSFWAAARGRWWSAGGLGAFAAATRSGGALLLPALIVARIQHLVRAPGLRDSDRSMSYWLSTLGALAPLLLVPIGLLAYMAYLDRVTGNAWAFRDIQSAWGRGSTFGIRSALKPLLGYALDPGGVAVAWNFVTLNACAAVGAIAAAIVLAVRREWAYAVYTISAVVVPLTTLTLDSMARFVLVLFPVYFVLAELGKRRAIDQTIRVAFIATLSLLSALFAAHFSFALA